MQINKFLRFQTFQLQLQGLTRTGVPTFAALGFAGFPSSFIASYIFKASSALSTPITVSKSLFLAIVKNVKKTKEKIRSGKRGSKKMGSMVFLMEKKFSRNNLLIKCATSIIKYEKMFTVPKGYTIGKPYKVQTRVHRCTCVQSVQVCVCVCSCGGRSDGRNGERGTE